MGNKSQFIKPVETSRQPVMVSDLQRSSGVLTGLVGAMILAGDLATVSSLIFACCESFSPVFLSVLSFPVTFLI